MTMPRVPFTLTPILFVALPLPALADPPAAEPIPAPRAVPAPVFHPLPYPLPPVPPQFGRMSVWQLYGVDRFGRVRPLVVQAPYGDYYRYNLAPFPWTSLYPREVAPKVVGTTLFPRVSGPAPVVAPLVPGPALIPLENTPSPPLMPYADD
jgi:hypothetical protein